MDEWTKKLYGVLDRVSGFFPQKQEVKSPVPESETLDTSGKRAFVAQEQSRQQATKQPADQNYPDFQYSSEIANAPSPDQKKATPLPDQQTNGTSSVGLKLSGGVGKKSYEQEISQVPTQAVNLLTNEILPITKDSGIPDAVVAAQFGNESDHGNSPIHKQTNNYFSLLYGGQMHKYKSVAN